MSSLSLKAAAERVVCVLLLPALALAIYCSARLAVADSYFRLNTPESLSTAVRIEPGDAAYHQLFAEHLESIGRDSVPEREKAALLSPLESRYWIDLGVVAEAKSDMPTAERYLLKAASVDRTFPPRWALMNFYFRQQRETQFWQWTRAALPMAHDDLSGLFRLCWIVNGDADFIRGLLPQTDYMRSQYLVFLMSNEHWDAAPEAAREIADRATESDLNLMLDYCAGEMTRNIVSAVEVWNALSRRNLEPFHPLAPREGAIVTNGEFRVPPIERGFDWRLSRADGVTLTMGQAVPGVSIELSGDQAEAVSLLEQWVPVEKGRSYRIDYEYSADGGADAPLSQTSGVAWVIGDPASKTAPAQSQDLRTAPGTLSGHFDFTASATAAFVLSLRYERAPGNVRHQEKFTILHVSSRVSP